MNYFKDKYAIRNRGNKSSSHQQVLLPCRDITANCVDETDLPIVNWTLKFFLKGDKKRHEMRKNSNEARRVFRYSPFGWPNLSPVQLLVTKTLLGVVRDCPGSLLADRALRELFRINDSQNRADIEAWVKETLKEFSCGLNVALETLDRLFEEVLVILLQD